MVCVDSAGMKTSGKADSGGMIIYVISAKGSADGRDGT